MRARHQGPPHAVHLSYFRRSSGPGWALPGDAGHFKDPVTAQGIRDALRFGRLARRGRGAGARRPARSTGRCGAWERRRDRECIEAYQWTNCSPGRRR